jgi:hypothetical protein
MLNPIKTPTQMMYEQAGIPHYDRGGVVGQFANRIQDAIRKYTKAVGKPPSAEEVKQLEDHIRSLSQPSAKPAETMARMKQQTPFSDQLVDASGRPYPPVTTPEGRTITPERAKGVTTRETIGPFQGVPSQFDMSPVNIKARNYPKGQFQNAFPEDEFMSMANTGRTANRTWNKSYTPSTEELASRQQLGEEAMELTDDAMGGLDALRVTEGDIPQMTSASAPFAERAAQLEGPGLDKLTDEMMLGKHGALVDKVVADFRARGIEPDQEDIVNAINAMINPMRHNYTGTNPISQRPMQGRGPATAEMNAWRDEARASGLPESVVTKHPSDWFPKNQRDYLLDTEPAQRQPFAKDWQMEELMDKRRREVQGKAAGGMMYSPRDMQAEMMVRGYSGGGQTQEQPTMEELTRYIREGQSKFPNSFDEVLMRNAEKARTDYEAREPKMSEYDPTPRERISSLGSNMLEKAGIRRHIARRAADTIVGGPSSNIPGGWGAMDIAAFVNPAVAMMQAPMFAAETGQNYRQGKYGDAAMSSLGALPLVGPIRKAYKGFNQ